MSTSGLSHAVSVLERRLGTRLFNRTTRSVAITETGEKFIRRVAAALAEIADAVEDVNSHQNLPSGTLRINTSKWTAKVILAPIIIKYLKRFPDMTIVLATDEAKIDVVAKGFDAGIRFTRSVPRDMIAVKIVQSNRMVVVGAPSYFVSRSKPLLPRDLLTHSCIRGRYTDGTIARWRFCHGDQEDEVEVSGTLVLDDWALMLEAALKAVGLAYLDYWSARPYIDSGKLATVLEDWSLAFPDFSLYYPRGRHVPAGLRALIALIREVGTANEE